jgi:hypothetical protein
MKHFDSGTIQAFLDGELSGGALERVSSHLATCEICTAALVEAESETATIDFAFAAENSFAVPTQRIWARIENEIEVLDDAKTRDKFVQPSLWERFAGAFGPAFLTRYATPAVGATALAVVVAFTLFNFNFPRQQQPPEFVQTGNQPQSQVGRSAITKNGDAQDSEIQTPFSAAPPAAENRRIVRSSGSFQAVKANYRASETRAPRTPFRKPAVNIVRPSRDLSAPLTEERAYLDAIDDLSQTVAASDEAVMRPSFQVEYEQNMAMMDRAISKMQRQVRRNPADENAKRILFASYQNKIDLLNTVAEKSQLMATLR